MTDEDIKAELVRVYKEYLADIESLEPSYWLSVYGLCTYISESGPNSHLVRMLQDSLMEEAGLCSIYPFGMKEYHNRENNFTQNKDPNRLAWVKHIIDGKPPQEFKLPVKIDD